MTSACYANRIRAGLFINRAFPEPVWGCIVRSWVLEQNENYSTLQLVVFSTSKSGRNFIDQESLSEIVANHPVYEDRRVLYALLYGSYRNRSEADNAKRSIGHLKPWIRQFKELHR